MATMTLQQLSDRLNQILKESPKQANQPFYVRRKLGRFLSEYVPVNWVGGGTLSIPGVGEITEAVCVDITFRWDERTGLKGGPLVWNRKGSSYNTSDGQYTIRHTGTAGRSSRVFTAYHNATGERVGNSGGLQACKEAVQRYVREKESRES